MLTSPRLVTRPESGVDRSASSRISVDLPSPFLPTMPIRSPSSRPRVTPSRTVRVAYETERFSPPSRCATGNCFLRCIDEVLRWVASKLLKERIGDDAGPVHRPVHGHGVEAVVAELF